MFKFSFKKKKKADPTSQKGAGSGRRFLLHVDPLGWNSVSLGEDGAMLGEPELWVNEELKKTGLARLQQNLQTAISANAKGLRNAKSISLLLGGVGIQYSDNKPKILAAASGGTARQFGQQLLNAPHLCAHGVPVREIPAVVTRVDAL